MNIFAAAGLTRALHSPVALLLITGSLIGMNFPLGKLGAESGAHPLSWALLISASAALTLFPYLVWRRRLSWPSATLRRYTATSALVSFVAPNLMLFAVIPHVGAGYSGLMFALSPVFTVLLATAFRLKTPNRLGQLGIAVGLVGAMIVSLTRGTQADGPQLGWLLLALAIPAALATGNIYRTLAWPTDAAPDVLAFWGHAFSSSVFILLLLITQQELPIHALYASGGAALGQALVAAFTFPVFFRLQQRGGPVLLSQIGYVAAAVGLLAATLFLDERYSAATWWGAAIIALGIALTIAAQLTEGSEAPAARGLSRVRPPSIGTNSPQLFTPSKSAGEQA